MEIIFSSFAVILCWLWIEGLIKISIMFNKKNPETHYLNLKKFKWFIRFTILILFSLIIIYMYLFENNEFQKVINLCFGIIR